MNHRNVWQLLTTLSLAEAQKFVKWLNVELEEKQYYVQATANYLVQHLPTAPQEQELWLHLYPEGSYDDARLRKILRDLGRWLEEFLAIESFRKNQDQTEIYLLRELHGRNRPKLFKKTYKRIAKSLETQPVRNGAYFRKQYEMESVYQQYLIKFRPKETQGHIHLLNQAFDGWWMHGKLEIACLNVSYTRSFESNVQNLFLKEVLTYMDHTPEYRQMSLLRIYQRLYLLLIDQGGTRESSTQIRTLVHAHMDKFALKELHTIFDLLVNFYVTKLSTTLATEYSEELFLVYEWGVEHQLIFQQGLLNLNHYKNIQTVCLQLEKYEQAYHYLESLREKLPEEVREDAYEFNKAKYLFTIGAFKEAIEGLKLVKFQQLIYEIPARILLIQAHYELSGAGQDWLITQIETLIRYIRNQQLPTTHKQAYLNCLLVVKKLANLLMPTQLKRIQQKIQTKRPLYQASWLNKKVSERLV